MSTATLPKGVCLTCREVVQADHVGETGYGHTVPEHDYPHGPECTTCPVPAPCGPVVPIGPLVDWISDLDEMLDDLLAGHTGECCADLEDDEGVCTECALLRWQWRDPRRQARDEAARAGGPELPDDLPF